MDLRFDDDDEAYRAELVTWLAENDDYKNLPTGLTKAVEASRAWQAKLYDAGYVGLAWPRDVGGQQATLTRQVIVAEEFAKAGVPPLINTIGLSIAGPSILRFGSPAQKAFHLPRILRATDIWCQGFSEPGAGSDLAAISTRAHADGDTYVVTGHKLWTSLGPIAQRCLLLVRSAPGTRGRDGLTVLLLDMTAPGVEVRPLRNAAGGQHFSEIYLDHVHIPATDRLGGDGDGWNVTKATLDSERSGLSGIVELNRQLGGLVRLARECGNDTDAVRERIARRWAEIEGLRHLGFRTLTNQLTDADAGPTAAVGKLVASELRQRIARDALWIEGPLAGLARGSSAAPNRARWSVRYLDALAHTIGGGTSEVMRNVLAERVLGLPRPPEAMP